MAKAPISRAARRPVAAGRAAEGAPRGIVAMAVWFGLATGLLELATMLVRRWVLGRAALGALQMNRHALWLMPVSETLIFAAIGLVPAALARRWPRAARRLAAYGLGFLSALALVLIVPGLSDLAQGALAAGVAAWVAPAILKHRPRFRALVGRSLPILAGLVAMLAAVGLGREVVAERLALARLPAPKAGAPNVLLIVLDTVRAESLGAYGYDRATSPNLDRFARRGVRFARARASASWTLPSHASMLTGRWPHELSARLDRPLDATYPTLAEYLRDRGYATAGFVANTFFCNAWYGLARGFLHYEDRPLTAVGAIRGSTLGRRLVHHVADSPRDRPGAHFRRKDAATIGRDALAWLDHRPTGRPFFLFLNYYDAHDPYLTPDEPDRAFGLRPSSDADVEMLRSWHTLDKSTLTPRDIRLARDCYDDAIARLDADLGHFLDELDRRGLLEETVVIVTADHGEAFGEHGGFGHGQGLHREVVGVPLLVIAPGRVPVDCVIDATVSLRDLPATVADLTGHAAESPFPGRSLAAHWSPSGADAAATADPILAEIVDREPDAPPGWAPPRSLVIDEHLYIRDADGREELYDLDADPREAHDLARDPDAAPLLSRFRDRLGRLETNDPARRGAAGGAAAQSNSRIKRPS